VRFPPLARTGRDRFKCFQVTCWRRKCGIHALPDGTAHRKLGRMRIADKRYGVFPAPADFSAEELSGWSCGLGAQAGMPRSIAVPSS
jgi:hypothetical protein